MLKDLSSKGVPLEHYGRDDDTSFILIFKQLIIPQDDGYERKMSVVDL